MDAKLRNKMQKHVLWIDLEMTGLNPTEDRILEVGAIVTDWNFKEIATYEAAIKVGPRLVERRMFKGPSKDFWESVPETRDALIAQNKEKGRSGRTVENELLAFVDAHFEEGTPVILAGNSIHMDRRFIENEWHRLNARLHYRMLDVSAWKVVFEGKFKKKFSKREEHRALDDIRGSIEELRYYLTKFKKTAS
jgi:oligoribonuclease